MTGLYLAPSSCPHTCPWVFLNLSRLSLSPPTTSPSPFFFLLHPLSISISVQEQQHHLRPEHQQHHPHGQQHHPHGQQHLRPGAAAAASPSRGLESVCGRRSEMEDAAAVLPCFHRLPLSMLSVPADPRSDMRAAS
ncbi:hypothetical protein BRADI_2g39533v3 [Brachypodium distachyon]|uniref:Uncharacterized protein n=1 Tax=Brachypodium distachyon TaxID=15368 RepID=A0A0Q3MUS6_BRADI|nr:hypothetical protein BRADI_2g39533v3 [Brachypodium distachyon]